ncbi:Hypothetical protein CINCED_3A011991 [Cinara cedri]|uniref:Poly(A) RNA polymerase mitochondrial-like central palm domain-containing protein n=1 Tax=Cinara cedri TaxID=506608 RepID=A0A5E4NJZ4_9HEMI|nr:Hypothetical protein CINCED_3A011991 [Cinara cedri]
MSNTYECSLKNQHNYNKRSLKHGESYEPKHKKFKQNHFDSGYKSVVDVVTIFKLELQRILNNNNNKLSNTIIEDIQPYGSRISGIYTDDSDVDIHITYTSNLSFKKVIKLFADSIRKSNVFNQVVPIIHAKIPIIKCSFHKKTGIDCDISFNNISAVHNSYLLNYIISMDHRIKPVLTKFKSWAKNTGLICTNGFSSYSFYWIGLFCMQVKRILPPIYELQKNIPERIVGHWNCAFSKEQEFKKDNQKHLSESDILTMIYAYYSSFDFKTYVISPYVGCPLLKKDFENVDQLQPELWKYKQFHKENFEQTNLLFLRTSQFSMYTQDPFQHNLNITARVTPKVFEKFINACTELKDK